VRLKDGSRGENNDFYLRRWTKTLNKKLYKKDTTPLQLFLLSFNTGCSRVETRNLVVKMLTLLFFSSIKCQLRCNSCTSYREREVERNLKPSPPSRLAFSSRFRATFSSSSDDEDQRNAFHHFFIQSLIYHSKERVFLLIRCPTPSWQTTPTQILLMLSNTLRIRVLNLGVGTESLFISERLLLPLVWNVFFVCISGF